MNLLIVLAVVLAGSLLESAFAYLLADKPEKEEPFDTVTDGRYARLNESAEAA
jgi:hypothetical protein